MLPHCLTVMSYWNTIEWEKSHSWCYWKQLCNYKCTWWQLTCWVLHGKKIYKEVIKKHVDSPMVSCHAIPSPHRAGSWLTVASRDNTGVCVVSHGFLSKSCACSFCLSWISASNCEHRATVTWLPLWLGRDKNKCSVQWKAPTGADFVEQTRHSTTYNVMQQ